MTYWSRLANASQPPLVRAFAEAADALLDAADPETVSCGRGHAHALSRYRVEPGSARYEVPRTRRSRVTWMTAVIRVDCAGQISSECECPSSEAICEHLAAALIKLVEYVAGDDRRLMRLQGMSDKEIEVVEESRRPGRTRWGTSAYTDGPDMATAPRPHTGHAPRSPAGPASSCRG